MDGCACVYGLQFNRHQVFNQQIYAVAKVELDSIIEVGEANLGFRAKACLLEFGLQTDLIGAFEKAGTEFGMDSRRGCDDRVADLLGG